MVLAYHVIMTAYGFWLPNDPRGSWSDTVRAWELARFGPATKITTRASVANIPHNKALRLEAKGALKYEPVSFSGRQCLAIGHGFKDAIARSGFVIHACAILPEHTHLVVKRHRYRIELVRDQLKGQASKALHRENLHPFANVIMASGSPHTPWTDEGWDVFLNSPDDIYRAIAYVRQNPMKEGKPAQDWTFVKKYST